VNIRPREDWQDPDQPVTGPSMNLSTVDLLPAHYTADDVIPDDIPQYLRNMQSYYVSDRGYSVGYNFAIDQTGEAWELRGFDFKCAANKDMNEITIAVLCMVDGADAMNPAMCATFTALGAEAQDIVGRDLLVVGHRDIGSTSCPGDGIYSQVQAGLLDPDGSTPPPEPQPIPPGDTDMASSILIIEDANAPGAWYRSDGVVKTWIADGHMSEQVILRIEESAGGSRPAVDGFVYRYIKNGNEDFIASCGPIVGPRPDGHDEYGRH
jgi:hypothetical protein